MGRPASTSTTLAPDSASSFASTPPAAPEPITHTSNTGGLSIPVFRVRTAWKLEQHSVALIFEILMNADRGGIIFVNRSVLQDHKELFFRRARLVLVAADSLHQRRLLGFATFGVFLPVLAHG